MRSKRAVLGATILAMAVLLVTPAQSQGIDPECIDQMEKHCGRFSQAVDVSKSVLMTTKTSFHRCVSSSLWRERPKPLPV